MDELALGRVAGRVSPHDDAEAERAFEQCLAESATLAFRVAYGVLRHRQDAEDVAQEAMVQAYRRFVTLRDRGRFRAWLVRIAWRTALNRRRHDGRRNVREQAALDIPPVPTVEDLAISRDFQEHLWREIDGLPDRLRRVLTLAAMEGFELAEVAELLELPEGTVKSRLHQARKVLTERLQWIVTGTKRS
jgi:RNA polymerase sigma-70 factor (ECF subfamily)